MTCRHGPNDPNCSSHPSNVASRAAEATRHGWAQTEKELKDRIAVLQAQVVPSPDSVNYSIEAIEQVCGNVVMRVRYPNCAKCAYEGNKVMVFVNTTIKDVVFWRRIDPHFRKPVGAKPTTNTEAPSPSARFPGSDEGWQDAITYALGKKVSP